MPPKRKATSRRPKEATDSEDEVPKSKRPCPSKPRAKKSGPYKMPEPLPAGEVLTDVYKHGWKLAESVGKGGFGEIYRAAPVGKDKETNYVIKIEPQENGPLFTETAFYCRAAKPSMIDKWIKDHRLSYLAIPEFISQGQHRHGSLSYRFLVMRCFGEDVEKKFNQNGRKFQIKTVCHLALRILEALHYLCMSEYAHGDIKGSNLLTGLHPSQQHEVYLVDYGLAYRYRIDGRPKAYKEDPRRKHDGTLEFTSIDAHKGVTPSPRGDLEILAYCLLQWSAGSLPWEQCLDKDRVAQMKIRYRSNINGLLKDCFSSGGAPRCLRQYLEYVHGLEYEAVPDYSQMKALFLDELKSHGVRDDGRDLDWTTVKKRPRMPSVEECDSGSKRAKPGASSRAGKQRVNDSVVPEKEPKKKVTRAVAKPRIKGKTRQPLDEESVAVAAPIKPFSCSGSSSGGATEVPMVPVVSYPAALGYAQSGSSEDEVQPTKLRKKTVGKKTNPRGTRRTVTSPKGKKQPKRVTPLKRRVCKNLDIDTDDDSVPVKHRR